MVSRFREGGLGVVAEVALLAWPVALGHIERDLVLHGSSQVGGRVRPRSANSLFANRGGIL